VHGDKKLNKPAKKVTGINTPMPFWDELSKELLGVVTISAITATIMTPITPHSSGRQEVFASMSNHFL
jgi:hypothetical protein